MTTVIDSGPLRGPIHFYGGLVAARYGGRGPRRPEAAPGAVVGPLLGTEAPARVLFLG